MRRAALLALLAAALALPAAAQDAPVPEAWRDFLHSLPAEARTRAAESLERMDPATRERLLERFARLPQEERDEIGRLARGEPPSPRAEAKREALEGNLRTWQELSPDEREALRARLRAFRALPAGEQQALVERRFAERSAEERREILGRLRSAGSAPR